MNGDTISRQAAIDALGEEPEVWSGNDEYAQGLNNQWHCDINALKALPCVKPQNIGGTWLIVENPNYSPFDGSSENIMICSVCGYRQEQRDFIYCPICGSENGGKKYE